MFVVKKHKNLEADDVSARVLMPISMGKKQHAGEMLAALVNFAKSFNTTILVADYLYRFNVGAEKALQMGDKFLEKNKEILREAIIIENVNDWGKYKNQHLLKIVRWEAWREIKKNHWFYFNELIKKESEEGSSLSVSMNVTAQSQGINNPEEVQASVDYQKEENAFLFTFCQEFTHHFYPGDLNNSQAEVYRLFSNKYEFPKHVVAVLERVMHVSHLGVFSENGKRVERKEKSLHVALRSLVPHIEILMSSPEISLSSKQLFIKKIQEVFQSVTANEIPEEKVCKPC
jgi:hypothetical protein